MPEITMPKLSDTMEEGRVLRWLKNEGDYVAKGEVLFEVETDKAVMEVESFFSGILQKILVRENDVAPVGSVIAIVAMGAEAGIPTERQTRVTEKPRVAKPLPDTDKKPRQARKLVTVGRGKGLKVVAKQGAKVLASPAARRIAEEKGIPLEGVEGTGPDGMVTVGDVTAYLEKVGGAPSRGEVEAQGAPKELAPKEGPSEEEVTKLSTMRRAIATKVTYSKQNIPHFYVTFEVDMPHALAALDSLSGAVPQQEKITLNDLVIKGVAGLLKQYPALNAVYPEEGFIMKREVNVGVIVGLDEGLLIPVIKNCDRLSLSQISKEVKGMRGKIDAGKLTSGDLSGGTFSISNLGPLGAEDFSAIIYPPQTAILAVGSVHEKPVVREGKIVVSKRMKMTLSVDHRVADGIMAANFLRDLKGWLETFRPEGLT